MFCPKCGSQNADETKFCRGCGADVSDVPTALKVKGPVSRALVEKQIDLYGSGIRGLMIGFGFLITSGVAFAVSIRMAVIGVFMLAFASFFLGTGVSKLLQSRAIRKLLSPEPPERLSSSPAELPDHVQPPRSLYETDDLERIPGSVTERTTNLLEKKSIR